MSTISFSTEESIKRDITSWAKSARKSKSDLFRDMVLSYGFNQQLQYFTDKTDVVLAELGIVDEAQLYDYLSSDETYKDRLRH
ncbi:hypothetical protein HY003_04330 [Candidatus Saccharibacteria bacterium]|nr:hypothetical protein [Candidatus Saccharibacteria bacterium]MBI3338496.1 hypothetical protein [Candidatus Saccharibacteria bacterium]